MERSHEDLYLPHSLFKVVDGIQEIVIKEGSAVYGCEEIQDIKLLLITDSIEYLYGFDYLPDGFSRVHDPKLSAGLIYERPASLFKGMKAAYPVVDGVPAIVIGTPINTDLTLHEWILTILHEHFHIIQMNQPGYFSGVESLNLSGGDQSGMWMLNYNFPYESPAIGSLIRELGVVLADAIELNDLNNNELKEVVSKLKVVVPEADLRYMEFQLWQEGIARYIEYEYSKVLGVMRDTELNPEFEMRDLANKKFSGGIQNLRSIDVSVDQRVVFYDLGWGIGMYLSTIDPYWKTKYWNKPFKILDRLH